MINIPRVFKKLALAIAMFAACFMVFAPVAPVFAAPLSPNEEEALNQYTNWVGLCGSTITDSSATTEAAAEVENVFIVGDSITAGAKSAYEQAFQKKDIKVDIDGSSSRGLNIKGVDGNKLTGMQAIDRNKDKIKGSDAIVIALGTNGGNTKESVDKAIDEIRKINKSAPIYWVDTISVGRGDNYNRDVIGPANKAIYSESRREGKTYEIIPWFNAVSSRGNAEKPTKAETDPKGHIDNSDGLGVHLTSKGTAALTELVVDSVSGPTTLDGSNSDLVESAEDVVCCPTDSSESEVVLTGGDTPEQIYNYFIDKGLKPYQAAGILGNMALENGAFDPTVIEGGNKSQNPLDAGGGGYGLVQWTPGHKTLSIKKAAGIKGHVYEVGTQLEILWAQLDGKAGAWSETQAGDDLKKTVDVEDATRAFQGDNNVGGKYFGYERPGSQSATLQERIAAARGFLTKFGSGGGGGGGSEGSIGSANACCPPSQGAVIDDGSPSEWKKMYTGANKAKVAKMAHGDIDPNTLVIHYTVGPQEGQDLLDFFAGAGTGIQFNVGKDGQIYQYYPLNDMKKTYHVGEANSKAIGIEITGKDAKDLLSNQKQFEAVVSLAKFLCQKYDIPCSEPKGDITGDGIDKMQGMLGHDEVPTNDHRDPDAVGNEPIDRADSSKHPYMMKLRTAMGFEPTPGKKGQANGGGESGSAGGSEAASGQCPGADTAGGSGTKENPVGEGPNRALALEAVQYDTKTNKNKYYYVMGGLHGALSQLQKFAQDGGGVDCSGFVRYVIWKTYGKDVGSFTTQTMPSMSDFKEVSPSEVAAGDIGWNTGHVDFITENKGGGKLHQFGAHSTANDLYGGPTSAGSYEKYFRYVGPKGQGEH